MLEIFNQILAILGYIDLFSDILWRKKIMNLLTIFLLSCPDMKRRLCFEAINWLHDLPHDIPHERCHDKPHVRLHGRQHEWPHWQYHDRPKLWYQGSFAIFQYFMCVLKPLHVEMKSHTGCIWLINRMFSINYIFWKNITKKIKQPYCLVPGPSMAVRPAE